MDYEGSVSGWSPEAVLAYGEKLWDIACSSIERGLAGGFSFEGITTPHATALHQAFSQQPLIPMGIGAIGCQAEIGCANVAACGFPATVPLEEMIQAILRVGEKMRPCNALGTCATPTGCRLTEETAQS